MKSDFFNKLRSYFAKYKREAGTQWDSKRLALLITLHYHKLLTPHTSPRGESQSKFNIPSATTGGARRGEPRSEAEAVFFFFIFFLFFLCCTFSARNMSRREGRVWRERIMSRLTFQFQQFRENRRAAKSVSLKDNHHNEPVTDLLLLPTCGCVCVARSSG